MLYVNAAKDAQTYIVFPCQIALDYNMISKDHEHTPSTDSLHTSKVLALLDS